jgi:integrase
MASVTEDPNGRKRIQFVAADGLRKAIRLGKCDRRTADEVSSHIEKIVSATMLDTSIDRKTIEWLTTLNPVIYAKLAAVGVVRAREAAGKTTLGQFINQYITSRTDLKPRTIANLKQAETSLVKFFGSARDIRTITKGEAKDWKRGLGESLAEATIAMHVKKARQFFIDALDRKLITESPFAKLDIGSQANDEREFFVTRDMAAKVLAKCPDVQWRLLFGLSRYGGLRCPSEHLALRWRDIDWEGDRILISSPKTEHHKGKGCRFIPLFPELRKDLMDALEAVEPGEGSEWVITKCRDSSTNLRTGLERIIKLAGVDVWPKLFQNLRSTRQTELAEKFPIHVVCAWLGNSQAIAKKHYLQVTDAHFSEAAAETIAGKPDASQKPSQSVAQSEVVNAQTVGAMNEDSGDLPGEYVALPHTPIEIIPPRGVEPLFAG